MKGGKLVKSRRTSVIGSGRAKIKHCRSYKEAAAMAVATRPNALGCSDCSDFEADSKRIRSAFEADSKRIRSGFATAVIAVVGTAMMLDVDQKQCQHKGSREYSIFWELKRL